MNAFQTLTACEACEGRGRVCTGHRMTDPFSAPETCSERECARQDTCDECKGTGVAVAEAVSA